MEVFAYIISVIKNLHTLCLWKRLACTVIAAVFTKLAIKCAKFGQQLGGGWQGSFMTSQS